MQLRRGRKLWGLEELVPGGVLAWLLHQGETGLAVVVRLYIFIVAMA
jgi:hypothetical protein